MGTLVLDIAYDKKLNGQISIGHCLFKYPMCASFPWQIVAKIKSEKKEKKIVAFGLTHVDAETVQVSQHDSRELPEILETSVTQ